MDCVKRAIKAGLAFSGIKEVAPNMNTSKQIKTWAENHGLRYVDSGVLENYKCAVLVTYLTERGDYHTVFASDIGPFCGRQIHHIVVGWEEI